MNLMILTFALMVKSPIDEAMPALHFLAEKLLLVAFLKL